MASWMEDDDACRNGMLIVDRSKRVRSKSKEVGATATTYIPFPTLSYT